MRVTEDERDKVFEEFQTAEEKLLSAEEVATKVSDPAVHEFPSNCSLFLSFFLSSVLSCPLLSRPVFHCTRSCACARSRNSVSTLITSETAPH